MVKEKPSEYVIGIDMGTNSIGWSVVAEHEGEPKELIDCGSRIFIRSVQDKTPTPKNQERRNKRLMRRVIERRHRRKVRLRNYLISRKFLPETLKDEPNPEIELNKLGDPYKIRAKALDEELTLFEFGRAILHLGTRRGFLSNRKTGFGDLREDPESLEILDLIDSEGEEPNPDKKAKSDKEKEESEFKEHIKKLRKEINESGARTLGEYVATLNRKRNRGEFHDRRTDRRMYQEEIDKIFEKQSKLKPEIYTEDVKKAIKEIIFFQRPIRWDKKTIGKCSLEPNKRRTEIGRLEFQQFRYWQDINNLSWNDLDTGEVDAKPSMEQKNLIARELEQNKNLTWAKIKKTLKLKNRKTKFNLEKVEGKSRKGIPGNKTACGIRSIIGKTWDSFDEKKQKQLVEDLISYKSKKGLKKRLQKDSELKAQAVKLAVLELEEGHGNLSLKAINKILPHLKQGIRYNPDAVQAAGYKEITVPKKDNRDTLPTPPDIPNPIVSKALSEVRRVVNAIIKEYGKPVAIRVEMARDLEMNTKKYKKAQERQEKNTKANEKAEEDYNKIRQQNPHLELREYISPQDKLKYRLWKESGYKCSYSGKSINLTDLWSADIEIDHIIPYSRSLDNSYMNKVVCFADQNRTKANQTPWEAFGGTEQWNTIESIIRGENYPVAKCKRIISREVSSSVDNFINNQLTDARYIAKETGNYMRKLGCDVTFTKGGITSWLRYQWGLNKILGDTGEKNRADHRHHAIDATVTALTSRSLYQRIVHLAQQADDDSISPEYGLEVPRVLDNLRDKLEDTVKKMIVSHSTNRKLTGAFHEDTAYGLREKDGKKVVVVRKNLAKMTENELENIVCPVIKEGFEAYVNMRGGLKTAQKKLKDNPFRHPKTGDTVRRARVVSKKTFNPDSYWQHKDKATGKLLRLLPYGNNHHVEIIRNLNDDKYKGVFVTTMEAAARVRISKEPIINTNHGEDWEFIMSLCKNDMVSVEKNEEERRFYRVQVLDPDGDRLSLRLHTAATLGKDEEKLRASINNLMTKYKMKKESINALGRRLTNPD